MIRLLVAPIAIVITYVVVFSIASREARKAELVMDQNDFVIRQPKASLKVYIFVTVFFFLLYAFSLLGLADGGDIGRWWVFLLAMLPFLALGPFLAVLWYRWKIAVKENTITVCPFFGGKKTFSFDYITTVKSGANATRMGKIEYIKAYHEGKKLFAVTSVCAGFQVLVSRLKDSSLTIEWK